MTAFSAMLGGDAPRRRITRFTGNFNVAEKVGEGF